MFGRVVLLFVLLPFVEMALLLMLADATSWRVALAAVIVAGIAGAWLLRAQGLRTWRTLRSEFAAGRVPADALWDAAMLLVAGALLLTPGVLTDLVGIALLFPPCRRWLRRWLERRLRSRTHFRWSSSKSDAVGSEQSEVIDSYVVKRHP